MNLHFVVLLQEIAIARMFAVQLLFAIENANTVKDAITFAKTISLSIITVPKQIKRLLYAMDVAIKVGADSINTTIELLEHKKHTERF